MLLKLNVYTDETLTEVKRVVEADKLKIPYRVAMYLIQSLDSIDFNDDEDLVKFISQNIDKMDKVLKATFNLTESELECLDTAELIGVISELFKWGVENVNKLKDGNNQKNAWRPASR